MSLIESVRTEFWASKAYYDSKDCSSSSCNFSFFNFNKWHSPLLSFTLTCKILMAFSNSGSFLVSISSCYRSTFSFSRNWFLTNTVSYSYLRRSNSSFWSRRIDMSLSWTFEFSYICLYCSTYSLSSLIISALSSRTSLRSFRAFYSSRSLNLISASYLPMSSSAWIE